MNAGPDGQHEGDPDEDRPEQMDIEGKIVIVKDEEVGGRQLCEVFELAEPIGRNNDPF